MNLHLAWLALASAIVTPCLAQQAPTALPDRLGRIPGGYLGIVEEGALTRLTLYDQSLRQRAASAVFGLHPVDLRTPGTAPSRREAWLLARPLGASVVFRVPLDGAPEPTPVWRDDRRDLDRIIATGELDSINGTDVLLAGDSTVVLAGVDGKTRYHLDAVILGAFTTFLGRDFVLISEDAPSSIIVSVHSIETGEALASRRLPWVREPIVTLIGRNDRSAGALVVAGTSAPGRVFVIEPHGDLPFVEYTLPAVPFAIVPSGLSERRESGIAAVTRTYPEPEVIELDSDLEPRALDYPLRDAFHVVAVGSSLIALVTRDSAAIYDRKFRLLGVIASPGSGNPVFIEQSSTSFLLSTDEGTRQFDVDWSGRSWIVENWEVAVAIAAFLALVAIAIGFAARYAEVTTIYFNLVGVPSSHGVIVLSRTQRVRRMNASAQAMLGISPYIPLGRHLSEYLNREEHKAAMLDARRLFSTGEPFERRVDVPADGGTRALTFRGRTMLSRGGFKAGYLLLIEDVTQTIEKERLVNWASVAHHIAHEMKTPLGTVQMTAEMLRDRLGNNGREEEYQRATSRILKQSERLRAIVEDLLTVARTEALQKVRADVGILVTSLVHEYGELMPAGSDIRLTITGEDHRAMVDVQQLTVALRNLLDNARHAIGSRDGGRISVTLTAEDTKLRLFVEDNGVGMLPETLARLFQPFYSEREGGSGIGTVIIKRVFEAHGGSVNVVSTPGVGTRFTLELQRQ